MKPPKLIFKEIVDPQASINFLRLNDFHNKDPFGKMSGEFREVDIGPGVDIKIPHNLSFTPKDIVLLHNSSNATVSFNYSKFTENFLYVNSSARTTLRFIVGRYEQ